jgi:NTP pyrophosphatase (non-canonical NTP hydrolase)
MEKFNQIFSQIRKINKIDPANPEKRFTKLGEEVGELAKAINKTNGQKVLKPKDTPQTIRKEIIYEAADTIQKVVSLVDCFNISATDLLNALFEKNKDWKKKITDGKRGIAVKESPVKKEIKTVANKKKQKKKDE